MTMAHLIDNKDKNIDISDIIKEELKKHLRVHINTDYLGYVEVELRYDNEVIDNASSQVITDVNPLDF
jgi:hypothetical protein